MGPSIPREEVGAQFSLPECCLLSQWCLFGSRSGVYSTSCEGPTTCPDSSCDGHSWSHLDSRTSVLVFPIIFLFRQSKSDPAAGNQRTLTSFKFMALTPPSFGWSLLPHLMTAYNSWHCVPGPAEMPSISRRPGTLFGELLHTVFSPPQNEEV